MMLETVEAGQVAWNEPGHSSAGEAVDFSKSFDRLHYKQEVESCVGQTIRSVRWSDAAFQLIFDDGKMVQFKRMDGAVDYSVVNGRSDEPFERFGMKDTVRLRLKEKEYVWKRADILNELKGRALRRIFVTPNRLFIYVSNSASLSVSTLINLRTSSEFLFWWPSD